MWDILFVVQRS